MPYGTIKVDTITFTDGGVDKSVAISGLVQNPTFTGNVTVTGTVSGATVRATTVSGVTISGTTVNAASGVFTTQISGAVVVTPAGLVGTPSIQVGTGASIAPGFYSAGTDQLGISTAGSSRLVVDSVGQIRVVTLGSAAAPALVVGNDLNTGLYSPGADQVAISTAGIGRLFVDASGNINLGQSSSALQSAGTGLTVYGSTASEIKFLNSATGTTDTDGSALVLVGADFTVNNREAGSIIFGTSNTERLRITSDGKVGIGTSSPVDKLHVDGRIAVTTDSSTPTTGEAFFYKSSSGAVVSGFSASIETGSAGSRQERLRITSDGKVGIGTSSPGAQTESRITGSGAAPATSGTSQPNAAFRVSGTSTTGVLDIGCNSAAPWIQATDRSDLSQKYSLLLNPNGGSVGIGTTSPGAILDVKVASDAKLLVQDGNTTGNVKFNAVNNAVNANVNLEISASNTQFFNGGSERARIDTSGRLLVGTGSSRQVNASINALQFQIEGLNYQSSSMSLVNNQNQSDGSYVVFGKSRGTSLNSSTIVNSGDLLGAFWYCGGDGTTLVRAATIECVVDGTPGTSDMPGRLVFSTTADGASSPTERMRIANTGKNSTYSTSDSFDIRTSLAAGVGNYLIFAAHSATGTGAGGTNSFSVFTNGNVQNTNNSYGALSDIKLKENIVDATSQWSDIKALKVRKYNFKEGQTHTQIGLVAQEVELVSPGLVSKSPDRDTEGNDLGTVTKGVNYSVLYMKAVKALQEAMERIETLEAKVAALESK